MTKINQELLNNYSKNKIIVIIECEYGTIKGFLYKKGKEYGIKNSKINFYFLPYQIKNLKILPNKKLKINLK